jgi:predicted transposase/invertase (TIGR01784 family)
MIVKKYLDNEILKDHIFKIVFGRQTSKKLLENFIERLIDEKVEIEQFINSEIIRERPKSKNVILDIVVKTTNDVIIAIEV